MNFNVNSQNLHRFLMEANDADSTIKETIFWKLVTRCPELLMKLANDEAIVISGTTMAAGVPEGFNLPMDDRYKTENLPFLHDCNRAWVTLAEFARIQNHMHLSHKVDAIKELRRVTGCGLKEAKDCVETGLFNPGSDWQHLFK